jgi:hypothetical protein
MIFSAHIQPTHLMFSFDCAIASSLIEPITLAITSQLLLIVSIRINCHFCASLKFQMRLISVPRFPIPTLELMWQLPIQPIIGLCFRAQNFWVFITHIDIHNALTPGIIRFDCLTACIALHCMVCQKQ